MPTNLLRRQPDPAAKPKRATAPAADRRVTITIADVSVDIALSATPTADVIWRALPLFSIVETWGESLHFEVPVHAGRDRTAKLNGQPGEIYFWADDDRIVLAWGPTPISRNGEIRLMRPCNVWARALGDLSVFSGIVPGAKLALRQAAPRSIGGEEQA